MSQTLERFIAVLVMLALVAGLAVTPAVGQPGGNASADNCSFPVTVTDDTGQNVTIGQEPQRVVVLAPSAAQVMWEIDADQKVVGMPVQYHTEYLNGSTEKTNVVTETGQPQIETIIDQEPDLVLAPNIVKAEAIEQLRASNLTVYRFARARSIEDVVAKTQLTGRLVGNYDQARTVSARTLATRNAYRNATAGVDRPTVYYAMGGGYTAGPDTFIGDVIEAAGGENVASAADIQEYGQINTEIISEENPEWIVVPSGTPVPSGPAINATTAVQEGQVLRVDANYVSQPGPRVVNPLETMATAFHPNATEDVAVNSSQVSTPECEAYGIDQSDSEGSSASGPGFGVVTGLVALLGAGLLARRV